MKARRSLCVLVAIILASVLVSGCSALSGSKGTDSIGIDLSDYSDMETGGVVIVMPDGSREDKYATGGFADMMEYAEKNEVAFDSKYKGATFVIKTKVEEVRKDYQTRSGKKYAVSLNLTNSTGKVYGGGKAPTYLSVESDEQTVLNEGIESGDIVLVAVKNIDTKYGCAPLPSLAKKAE